MVKQNKSYIVILALSLLAASCNLFGSSTTLGVVKTVNGGADWQFSNTVKNTDNATLSDLDVSKLAFDPGNHETLYVSAYNGGIYKSEDSGASWAQVLSKMLVYDFVVSPQDAKVLYAAGMFTDHGRLLYTKDAGATWQDIYTEESAGNPVTAVAINPASPSQIVLGLSTGNVVKSSDSGISWRLVGRFEDQVTQLSWQNGALYILLAEKGLMKSMDGGENFVELTTQLTQRSLTQRYFTSEAAPSFSRVHIDETTPSLIYLTTNSKLYKTVNEGAQWTQLTLPVDEAEAASWPVAVARASSNLVFTSIGSTMYKSTNGGSTWQTQDLATNGKINYILIDPILPQVVYAGIDSTN